MELRRLDVTTVLELFEQPVVVAHPARREVRPLLPDVAFHRKRQSGAEARMVAERRRHTGNALLTEVKQGDPQQVVGEQMPVDPVGRALRK